MVEAGRRVGAVVAAVLISLALGACGDGDDEEAPTTTVAPAASSTTEPPAPTSTVPVTTAVPSGESACPPIAARAPQPADQTIPVDFDGDGAPDTLRVYLDGGGDWHVRGEIGGDGFHDQIVNPLGPSGLEPIFGARLNPSDETEEAWVKIGSGASTAILTFFVFRDCELQRPTLGGNPAEFAVGASVGNASGVSCFMFDQGIEVFETQSEDGISYTGQSQLYTLNVSAQPVPTLDPVEGWPMPVDAGGPQAHLSRLTCGSETYP